MDRTHYFYKRIHHRIVFFSKYCGKFQLHDYNIEIVKILWHNTRMTNLRQRIL